MRSILLDTLSNDVNLIKSQLQSVSNFQNDVSNFQNEVGDLRKQVELLTLQIADQKLKVYISHNFRKFDSNVI